MSLAARTDLKKAFPEYHDTFVEVVGVEHILAGQVGVEGLRKVLGLRALRGPLAERVGVLLAMHLGPEGHERYMQFGEEVLGHILDLSSLHGLQERRDAENQRTGDYASAPIELEPAADFSAGWRFARTKLHVMRLPGNTIDLDLTQLRDNPRKHKGAVPWVWQFGVSLYAADPREGAQPFLERSSPTEWYRDTYMQANATNGHMLLDMYRLADAVDTVQGRSPTISPAV
ncbi:MAG TPA: hypothetical protein VLH86_02365 [Patescibacteria group bacterium]|nr:hypothetical protein [Patescibacteria group bacterium]